MLETTGWNMVPAVQSGGPGNIWNISEVAKTPEGTALLQRALNEILEGAAFKGRTRSAQFLQHIVRQTALGNVGALKERVIGAELFGRVPSYDTGGDSIVRVTATDVRKRLQRHYSRSVNVPGVRINLPPGKYVPELVRDLNSTDEELPLPRFPEDSRRRAALAPAPASEASARATARRKRRIWLPILLGTVTTIVCAAFVLASAFAHSNSPNELPAEVAYPAPWSSMFSREHPLLIVAGDPNIEEIQRISHSNVTLWDYENRRYLPEGISHLSPAEVGLVQSLLDGDKMYAFDGDIIAALVSLMPQGVHPVVDGARYVRPSDLANHQDLILLGSPRSNPWSSAYDSQLDFRFAFDDRTQAEFIRNLHPLAGEQTEYVPAANGSQTVVSYATISLVQYPGNNGQALIIAGATGEGTGAAGSVVADPSRWDSLLRPCHLSSPGTPQSLQLLLRLDTIAGSVQGIQVLACHVLHPGM